jgi:hypothetical protein
MGTLRSWADLWNEYPDYILFPDSSEVKKGIGGAVNASWITNTCAIRLSRALNYTGIAVPAHVHYLLTVKGSDRKRYALRVQEMRRWLEHTLGTPTFDLKKTKNAPFDKTLISSLKGIIAFDIAFSDATGHLDLWNANQFSSELTATKDYWTAATRISIWKAV